MAFASAIVGMQFVFGNKKVVWGTYTNGATDSGGDINTGLTLCEMMLLQPKGSGVTSAPVVNETLPIAGSAVTIVNTADEDGYWMAFGY